MATDADNLQFDQLYDQWIHDPLEALTISAEGQSTGGSVGALPLPTRGTSSLSGPSPAELIATAAAAGSTQDDHGAISSAALSPCQI
jgi:hypothetical protein